MGATTAAALVDAEYPAVSLTLWTPELKNPNVLAALFWRENRPSLASVYSVKLCYARPLFVLCAHTQQVTHKEPEEAVDHIALRGVRALRWSFDVLAGFKTGVVDEHKCEKILIPGSSKGY